MSKWGRKKFDVTTLSQKNDIFKYFTIPKSTSDAEKYANVSLMTLLVCAITDSDSNGITRSIVNEIADGVFTRVQKPTAHSGSRVSKKTLRDWIDKYPWLMIKDEDETIRLL